MDKITNIRVSFSFTINIIAYKLLHTARYFAAWLAFNQLLSTTVDRKIGSLHLLLVINSNFVRISIIPFSRCWRISLENIACFPYPILDAAPPNGGTHCDINVIHTPLESLSELQFLSQTLRLYLHLLSHCCLSKSQKHAKFRQNLTLHLQQFKGIQIHRSWCQSKTHKLCDLIPISD